MSLADSFLDDLDDLDSDGDDDAGDAAGPAAIAEGSDEDDDDGDGGLDDLDQVLGDIRSGGDLSSVASLRKSEPFRAHMAKIQASMSRPAVPIVGNVEDNPEYKLIVACNDMVQKVDEEMLVVYRFVCELYGKKFPELESLVPNKLDYLHAVKQIANEMDMTLVDLSSTLPNALVISVSMTGSTTSGQPLSDTDLHAALAGCDEAFALDQERSTILSFVETRMVDVAPNVCGLLDTVIAAQLMGLANGLVNMSKIPACNLQVMGQQKNLNMGGFGAAAGLPHTGLIYYSTVCQQAPPYLRKKALKVVAGKLALAARIDMHQSEPSGAAGQRMRAEIDAKIAKWQEPEKARTKRALPVPDERPSKKRGGKRARKYKEKFGMTETRKEANRRTFGDFSGEYGDDAMGSDMGMLGSKTKGGKLRLPPKREEKGASKAAKKKRALAMATADKAATNGLASNLVFTPVQGIELVGDTAAQRQAKINEANQKWFSQNSGFLSARPT